MILTIKESDENAIGLPKGLIAILNLREGSQVKVIVENGSLRLASFDTFLRLRGILADDIGFDDAFET